jgi:Protein of unknown function (DUF2934)
MNFHPVSPTITPDLAPSHSEIEQFARELWANSGKPKGRDDEIWLEAERRLISAQRAPLPYSDIPRMLARLRTPV